MAKKNKGRTLTVKGTGNVEVRPDLVVIDIDVEVKDENYEKSVEDAAKAVKELADALSAVGFEKDVLKTSEWDCEQVFKTIDVTKKGFREQEKETKRVFDCYRTSHSLKLEFPFSEIELPAVVGAIASCESVPEFNTSFTIRDKAAAANSVLEAATKDAVAKARIIAGASGVELGKPEMIIYNWIDYSFYSKTRYTTKSKDLFSRMSLNFHSTDMDTVRHSFEDCIVPDDIKLSDTVTFVWEIA